MLLLNKPLATRNPHPQASLESPSTPPDPSNRCWAYTVTDNVLLQRTKEFREPRNDVAHEEILVDGVLTKRLLKLAQDGAREAVALVIDLKQVIQTLH
jgi:hypothetical protein